MTFFALYLLSASRGAKSISGRAGRKHIRRFDARSSAPRKAKLGISARPTKPTQTSSGTIASNTRTLLRQAPSDEQLRQQHARLDDHVDGAEHAHRPARSGTARPQGVPARNRGRWLFSSRPRGKSRPDSAQVRAWADNPAAPPAASFQRSSFMNEQSNNLIDTCHSFNIWSSCPRRCRRADQITFIRHSQHRKIIKGIAYCQHITLFRKRLGHVVFLTGTLIKTAIRHKAKTIHMQAMTHSWRPA